MVKGGSAATRAQLIDATLALVAERGFAGVSVGDIEAAAGLAPRSGALYHYFDSKLAALEAAVDAHVRAVAAVGDEVGEGPAEPDVADIGRWLLDELDRERTLTHVVEREGERLPELRERMRDGVSERGYRMAASFVREWVEGDPAADHEALAVLVVGALVNVRRSTWTFGAPPLDVDDDRIVATLTWLVDAVRAAGSRQGA